MKKDVTPRRVMSHDDRTLPYNPGNRSQVFEYDQKSTKRRDHPKFTHRRWSYDVLRPV